MTRRKNIGAVVKVDSRLLKNVGEFINKNKFKYASKKQFVDFAVYELLKKEKNGKH